jgi:hypothetical protein
LALRVFLSGPWHRKQFSDRIGRMSRLKPTGFSGAFPLPAAAGTLKTMTAKTALMPIRFTGLPPP